jgi:hypothetical protein
MYKILWDVYETHRPERGQDELERYLWTNRSANGF